jgi:AP-4 complex subunit mu-1
LPPSTPSPSLPPPPPQLALAPPPPLPQIGNGSLAMRRARLSCGGSLHSAAWLAGASSSGLPHAPFPPPSLPFSLRSLAPSGRRPQFRGDVPKGVSEIFFRAVKFWKGGKGDPPPVFNVDGVNFLYTKKNGIYFMATTKFNVSPSFVLELLDRIARVFKDYCGVLTEESIRKNFVLLYELLDEMVDYGYPQSTSTESLKLYVHNEPVAVERAAAAASGGGILASRRTISSSAVQRPMSLMASGGGADRKNEIYVDILERLTVLFNSNGYVLNSTIDGCIQMKSYLQGNPGLRFALNEDLVVGKENAQGGGGGGYGAGPALVLDDCNFHECVNLDDFEGGRTLALIPPDGEFVVMNYRITSEFRAPFRIFPALEEQSQYKLELVLRVRADIPEKAHGANVVVRFPVPKTATTVIPEIGLDGALAGGGGGGGGGGPGAGAAARSSAAASAAAAAAVGQTAEYDAKERQVVWVIKKFAGGTEQTLRTRITLGSPSSSTLRKELGPISMNFEIPMHNVSSLQVKYLKIAEAASTKANRWVRYVTTSNSYVCRL